MSNAKANLHYMVQLYNFTFTEQVPKDHQFSNEELYRLQPEHIYPYFAHLAYGTTSPSADNTPIHARSSTLEFAKKAISSFQPNHLIPWNEQSRTGNSTCSPLVNDVIKQIKKGEVSFKMFLFNIIY